MQRKQGELGESELASWVSDEGADFLLPSNTSGQNAMGLRCLCPQGHILNIQSELVGKRGKCPVCSTEFIITHEPADTQPAAQSTVAQPASSEQTAPTERPAASSSPAETSTQNEPPAPPIAPPAEETIEWRLASPEGEQFGPSDPTAFAEWITQGRVPDDWLVWRTGWSDWRRAGEAESELPAPLPQVSMADAPLEPAPPLVKQKSPASKTQTAEANPTQEYTLRRLRAARRQQMIILLLGVMTLALVGVLVWLAMK